MFPSTSILDFNADPLNPIWGKKLLIYPLAFGFSCRTACKENAAGCLTGPRHAWVITEHQRDYVL